jgi:hypothetical protein
VAAAEQRRWATPGGISSILRIQADRAPTLVIRQGRFSVEEGVQSSPVHFAQAIAEAQRRMIEGLKSRPEGAYEYVDRGPGFAGFLLEGPYEHLAASEDMTPDRGTLAPPPPPSLSEVSDEVLANYRRLCRKYEAADKALAARELTGVATDLVDFVLKAHFRRMLSPGFRVHVPYQHEVAAVNAAHRLATATR